MGLELERSDNAEISTSAAERPEEIVVFRSAGSEHFAVGCDHLRRQQIVDGHTVFTDQPTNTSSERKATNTSLWHYDTRNAKSQKMHLSITSTKSPSGM